ncbi:MFS general substrate transporter [Sodiomyces alkalinus F11]|uniref:MFS general substrate transporter n=1 Tax=Sodiomyces alkalinus (strain CBS 110278 / VKM F-3762 / F11) TaxID=1314773 RepID=A0A3N2PIV4_SODAK|nr:MFS general substrate transporter [Sodiomyces alkalinus F11]ROT34483.1 MFS general substrate transporter [Sodiomyces alkalinus F11]
MRFLSSIGADVLWRSSRDLKLLILLRFIRLLGYGGTTFVLALYLSALGFHDTQIGLFMTMTLVGDFAISFVLIYVGDRMGVRFTAIIGALLMCVGGLAFAWLDNFWLLLLASVVGVINPSANEIDPFKAIEESAIARLSSAETCNELFAWWSMLGMLGTAASNLATGWVIHASEEAGLEQVDCHRIIFLAYAGMGLLKLVCSLFLSRQVERGTTAGERERERERGRRDSQCQSPRLPAYDQRHDDEESDLESERGEGDDAPLLGETTPGNGYGAVAAATSAEAGEVQSASHVLKETAKVSKRVFSPSSFSFMWKLSLAMGFDFIGSGLAQISWMTYFFKREYDVPEGALGSATFTAGIISAVLNLASSPLSRAIGQVQTMVLCHTINSISLLIVSVPGNKYVALAIFIFRIVTRELDSAPRQAFISAGVSDEERTSAMGVVNLVKTIGSCLGLYMTGLFAGLDQFWLAFIVAGSLKLVYNVLISVFFWRRNSGLREQGA